MKIVHLSEHFLENNIRHLDINMLLLLISNLNKKLNINLFLFLFIFAFLLPLRILKNINIFKR